MKLTISPRTPNPRRVTMFIAEKGITGIEEVALDLMAGQHRDPAFLAKNPLGRVPALRVEDGTVLTETVADTIMALVLSSARRVVEVAERVKKGEWTKSIGPDWFGVDVHGKTLGIVGMGRIGLALAQRAHFGFNMPILYNARRRHNEAEERFNARYCELDTLLQEADYVCLILPLTDETHHLIGKAAFEKMKKSAIFINAGRGPVPHAPARGGCPA